MSFLESNDLQGATFSTNADGTFTVEDTVSVDGKPGGGGICHYHYGMGWRGQRRTNHQLARRNGLVQLKFNAIA